MTKFKAYVSPEMTVTELDTKDIMSMSVIDNGQEDGTYKGEHSVFWGD